MTGHFNGDPPRWAVRALVWTLALIAAGAGVWLSGMPGLEARVSAVESTHQDIRREIRAEFRDIRQRIDRLLEREANRGRDRR